MRRSAIGKRLCTVHLFACACLVLWAPACPIAADPPTGGMIVGRVTDENGTAIVAAKVNALPLDFHPQGSAVRYVETDGDGRFTIDRLPWGKYSVFAMKEDAGYPDMEPSFYSDDLTVPKAIINPDAPVASLLIQLGPKAATVEGSVTDALTGAPINASFSLRRTAKTDDWLSTSLPSAYSVLVPARTNVSLSVTAPGHEKWVFAGPINLQSGQQMHLDVQLQPRYNPDVPASKFMIPANYVGWLLLAYNQKDAPGASETDGVRVFKFPETGRLEVSTPGPDPGAKKIYLYYSSDGSSHDVPMDYRGGDGMIWGEYDVSVHGVTTEFGFFVGTQEQYEKAKNRPPIQ